MRPNEQLSWALVGVSLLALPRWAIGALLFIRSDVRAVGPDILPTLLLILVAGVCSLLLLDLSQPLSALFALVAASLATSPLSLANYSPERYPIELFFPSVLWLVAATYPNSNSIWCRRIAIVVTSLSLSFFVVVIVGGDPYVWPAVFDSSVRNWEFIAGFSLLALIVMLWRFRGGERRQKAGLNRGRVLFLAFAPAFFVISLDLVLHLGARVLESRFLLPSVLAPLTLVALGWGIVTLTRAEFARQTEVRHEQSTSSSYRS